MVEDGGGRRRTAEDGGGRRRTVQDGGGRCRMAGRDCKLIKKRRLELNKRFLFGLVGGRIRGNVWVVLNVLIEASHSDCIGGYAVIKLSFL